MEQLVVQHRELLKISKDKTVYIKENKIDEFSKILMQERKQIQAIDQLETKRTQIVNEWFKQLEIDAGEQTVTILMEHIENKADKARLEETVAQLVDEMVEIRHAEKLNTELIEQSMEFVQLSLDMIQPSMSNMNYNQHSTSKTTRNNSVFDSKA